MAAERGFIQDVVVDERRGVDHFHGGSQDEVVVLDRSGDPGGQQQQGRPQTLAPQADPVFHQPVDERMVAAELPAEDLLDLIEFVGHGRIEVPEGGGGLCPW